MPEVSSSSAVSQHGSVSPRISAAQPYLRPPGASPFHFRPPRRRSWWAAGLVVLCLLAVGSSLHGDTSDGLSQPGAAAGPSKVTAGDAIGDVLAAEGMPQDVTRLVAERRDDDLHLELHFVDPISPADSGLANALYGFIDLDTDQLASTGELATVDYLSDRVSGLGSDVLVDLGTYSAVDRRVDVVDAAGGEVLARVPTTFETRSLALDVPLAVLGGDGLLSTVAAVGNLLAMTDVVPDGGFLATIAGEEVVLGGGRFRLDVTWQDFAGASGAGTLVFQSDDSAVFWFFDANNWELMVKVIDGCAFNDRFWVFSAATTNVEFNVRITDLQTGTVRSYRNPLGVSAAAVTDTAAFATCSAGGV